MTALTIIAIIIMILSAFFITVFLPIGFIDLALQNRKGIKRDTLTMITALVVFIVSIHLV